MFTVEVYKKGTTPQEYFTRNGDVTLEKCISCISKERLNGEYELEIVYPLKEVKSDYLKKWNVIKADGQLFRIYNTKNDYINNKISVYARHIFYDLDFNFTEDKRAVELTVKEAMEKALETDSLNKIFTLDSDINEKNTLYFIEESPLESIFRIIKRWGKGELIRDNFNITIRNDISYMENYEIRYKKNMLGLVVEENCENFLTKIYPVGYNGVTLPEKYIHVPNANISEENMPHQHITKKVKFDDAKDEVNLRIEAKRYVEKLGSPFTNVKCDLLEISEIDSHKRFTNIKKINIGDVCRVIHEEYSVETYMKCVYIEKDLIKSENNKIELGELKNILSKGPDFSDLYSKIEQSKTTLYFYQNNKEEIVKDKDYTQLFYEGISVLSNTHLKLYVALNGTSSMEGNVLDVYISVNNSQIPYHSKQKLELGENTIAFPLAIPALQGGDSYYISVKVKTNEGTFTIKENNAQVFAEGTGLAGGFGSDRPHIEVSEEITYQDCKLGDIEGFIIFTEEEPLKIKFGENISPHSVDLIIPKGLISDKLVITLIKVIDEYHFDKSEEIEFIFDKDIVEFVGEKNELEKETYIKPVNEVLTTLQKETFEDGFIYSGRLPIISKYKKIESESVVYDRQIFVFR